ncbi:MAG TPA: ABC transporter ATP-binding protein [Gemmataceae bacterium]|nr:ABC transporter ATP-binding protein [Gemmataceae bacterium]
MLVSPSPFRRLEAAFLRPYRAALMLASAGMCLQAVLALPIPIVQGHLLDRLLRDDSKTESDWTSLIVAALGITAFCLAGRAFLGWRIGLVMTRISLEVVKNLTDALHRKVRRLPLSFLDQSQTGELMSRLTSDVGTLLIFLSIGTLQLVSDLVLAGGIAALLIWLNGPLALVALAAVPLAALGHVGFARPLRKRSERSRTAFASLYALLSERLSALPVTRAFNQEPAELARLNDHLEIHAAASRRALHHSSIQAAAAVLVGGLGALAVVLFGASLVTAGRLSAGELLAFYALTTLLYAPIIRLAQFQVGMAETRVAMTRMVELLDQPDPPSTLLVRPAQGIRGDVVLQEITFRYRPGAAIALGNVNLHIAAGQTLGVVGPTGSGKSTLLALIANLYRPIAGKVLVDGAEVSNWNSGRLRQTVVLVPQRSILFEGTIRSNLCYAAPDACEARLWQVLEAVDLAALVLSRPGGLDASLGSGGSGLSGGQKQRLALARAVLAQPTVLLLDDSTSALDAQTEAKVFANVTRILPGVTLIIVSQKVSLVQNADQIIVLSSGRIVESGTHEDLLRLKGRYAELAGWSSHLAPTLCVPQPLLGIMPAANAPAAVPVSLT